jgi:hypothetical protein
MQGRKEGRIYREGVGEGESEIKAGHIYKDKNE